MQYTEEMKRFIVDHFTVAPVSEWHDAFNARFNTSVTQKNLYAYCKRHNIKSGRNGQFSKGQKPWNAGKSHPTSGMSAKTQFKPGNLPKNTRNLGETRICPKDGYTLVKVGHKKWRPKQLIVWEAHNGPIPKGHVVRFFNRSEHQLLNPTIDNLFCVSRGINARLNKIKANEWPENIRETLILIAKLEQKQYDLQRV